MQPAIDRDARPPELIDRVSNWARRIKLGRSKPILGWTVLLAVVVFYGMALTTSWSQIQPHLLHLRWKYVLMGQVSVVMAFLLGGFTWFLVQAGHGFQATWQQGLLTHLVANATKYLPGYAWQYLTKGYLAKEQGVSVRRLTLAIATELVLLLSAGIVVASVAGSLAAAQWRFPLAVPTWGWQAMGLLGVMAAFLWEAYVKRDLNREGRVVGHGCLAGAWFVAAVGWLLYAAACWLFVLALDDVPPIGFAQCLAALVMAGIVSILVIIVPNGLGVREATLAALLIGLVPFALGLVVSILMRVSVIISELLGFLLIILLVHHWPERLKSVYLLWGIRQNTPK